MSDNTNAKQEFVEHTEATNSAVKCAQITKDYYEPEFTIDLKVGHTLAEYAEFLEKLDFSYDSGYGGQMLYGTIWYDDGTWSERGEYDGSEWWEHRTVPPILDALKGD